MITVIGLGRTDGDLTDSAKQALAAATHVVLRTGKSAAGKGVLRLFGKSKQIETLDELYDSAPDFSALNENIAARLQELDARQEGVVYGVDGDGYSDETVLHYMRTGGAVRVVAGVADCGARRPAAALVSIAAYELLDARPYLDTALPLLVTGIDNQMLAGAVKLYLMQFYGDETPLLLQTGGGEISLPLTDLDRQKKYDYAVSAYLPAQAAFAKQRYGMGDLVRILARLTAPDGCPWDKEQTMQSIRVNVIEEAYEAVDAIDADDDDDCIEEFGDLLLQPALLCDIAMRSGRFGLSDVFSELCGKLIGRHTHIFGADRAGNAAEALGFWDAAKAEEKQYQSTADQLSRLPEGFPALLRAEKALKKMRKAGTALPAGCACDAVRAALTEQGPSADTGKLLLLAVACSLDAQAHGEVELHGAVRTLIRQFAEAERQGDVTAVFTDFVSNGPKQDKKA